MVFGVWCFHKFLLDPYYEPLPWFMMNGYSQRYSSLNRDMHQKLLLGLRRASVSVLSLDLQGRRITVNFKDIQILTQTLWLLYVY